MASDKTNSTTKEHARRAYRQLRFGMFVHFGLYSLGGEHEWHLHRKRMNITKYRSQFLPRFDPDPAGIDQWVQTAKVMGAKYIVCTSKHHEGFCLWDTQVPHAVLPDYHIRNTPFFQKHNRGVLDYLFEAGRKHGIRIGLYYSVVDWSWSKKPLFTFHPHLSPDPCVHQQYVDYYVAQLHELKAKFPDTLCFWFDGYHFQETFAQRLEQNRVYSELSEKYPDLMVVQNTGVTDRINIKGKTDLLVLENADHDNTLHPVLWPRDDPGHLPGELCCTLNRHWGYNSQDHEYKDPEIIARVVKDNDANRDTNTLLNFGPHWNGFIVDEQIQIARKIGQLL